MDFFKSKINIVLVAVQVTAILLFLLGNFWSICFVLAVMSEGVFLIVLGVKTFNGNKQLKKKEEMLMGLPMDKLELENMKKRNSRIIKSNKLQGVLYIVMGLIFLFIGVF